MTNRSDRKVRALLSLILAAGGAAYAAAQVATSVKADGSADEVKLEKFEVTGSRIKRLDVEGPSPITVISRQDIELSGRSNVAEILRDMPENGFTGLNEASTTGAVRGATGLNLRNLGTNNTLVLLDGRRTAPYAINSGGTVFFNLGSIPMSAIERIEVLKDGASAIYGADATAGVVNVILRKDYTGLETSFRYGNSLDHDAGELSASISGGASAGKARAMVGVDYFRRNAMAAKDADFSKNADLSSRYANRRVPVGVLMGSGGFYDLRSGTGPYATVSVPTASQLTANGITSPQINPLTGTSVTALPGTGGTNAGTLTTASVPFGSANDGTPTRSEFIARRFVAGSESNLYNFQDFVWLTPFSERKGTFARFAYDFNPNLSAFLDVSYQNNFSEIRLAPSPISTAGDNNILVPATNFYNPFGVAVAFTYRPLEVGPRIAQIDEEFYRGLAGLKGTIADKFDWEVGALYSYNQTYDTTKNSALSESRVRAALAKTDATALNIFGGPGFKNNAATIESLKVSSYKAGEASLGVFDARISGDIFEIYSGPLSAAVYAEYREEVFREQNDDISVKLDDIIGQVRLADPTDAYRNVTSFAAELGLPLVRTGTVPFVYAADLSLAGRFESFSDFGDSTKPKVGVTYQPIKELLLRGTYSEGFRAPTLSQLFGGIRESLPSGLSDPSRPQALTGDPFDGSSTQRLVREGGNPNLKPEEAQSWSYGAVWEPEYRLIKGLQVGISFFDITQTDRIGNVGSNSFILANEYVGGYEGFVVRNSGNETYTNNTTGNINVLTKNGTVTVAPGASITVPGRISYIKNQVANVAKRSVEGWDFDVRYTKKTNSYGRFTFNSTFTLVTSIWNQASPTSTGSELNGTDGYANLRMQNRVGWNYKQYGVSIANQYTSSYGDVERNGYEIDPYSVYSLQLSYDIASGILAKTHLTLTVDNIMDEDPPLYYNGIGYDSSMIGRPQGRFVYFGIRREF